MNKKKVLFTYGHARGPQSWGMFAEIIKRLLDNKENEVYFLCCNGLFPGLCWFSTHKHIGYCKKCLLPCKKLARIAGLEDKKILNLRKIKIREKFEFNNIEDAIQLTYKGFNIGLSPISTIMTITRDYNFCIKFWKKHIHKLLNEECVILENIIDFDKKIGFDEIHCFTGRTPTTYPLVEYAKIKKLPFFVYEVGANLNKLCIDTNAMPHEFYNLKNNIQKAWRLSSSDNREALAKKWFDDRRKGKFQAMESFMKNQEKDLLPKDFCVDKENIVFFNSSIDEVYAFDCWKHPFVKNENDLLYNLLEHYKNDESKHFYIRVHPNLTEAKKKCTTQIKELSEFKKRYKNLTIIEPDEKIDTYALMDIADKVLTTYSTAGFEASYYGKISIFAGKAPYEDLDCCYQAKSLEELYKLIDSKDLKPKPKENTYPYAYYNQTYGEDYKYYNAYSLNEGNFMGFKIYSKQKMECFK